MSSVRLTSFVLPLLLTLFTACTSDVVSHTYQALPPQGWSRTDTLAFTIDLATFAPELRHGRDPRLRLSNRSKLHSPRPARGSSIVHCPLSIDSAACYSLWVDVRHRADFRYRQLWLQVLAPQPAGGRPDTLCLTLADEQGRWTGRGWGGLYGERIAAGNLHVDTLGTYTLRIVHLMPDSLLRGVSDVGLLVRRER